MCWGFYAYPYPYNVHLQSTERWGWKTNNPKGSARARYTHNKMLSIEKCKEILKQEGIKLEDNQIKEVREFLYAIANIEIRAMNTNDSDIK